MPKQSLTQIQTGAQKQTRTQVQKQSISQRQAQSLKILRAPYLSAIEMIKEELDTNPALEQIQSGSVFPDGNPVEDYDPATPLGKYDIRYLIRDDDNSERENLHTEVPETTLSPSEAAHPEDSTWPGESILSDFSAKEKNIRQWDNLTVRPNPSASLFEELDRQLSELRHNGVGESHLQCCVRIIEKLNDNGWFKASPKTIARNCGCTVDIVREALKTVQSFYPPGTAARDSRECLMLQLEHNGRVGSPAWQLLKRHSSLLEKYLDPGRDNIRALAGSLKLGEREVTDAIKEMRELVPFPVCLFASPCLPQYVMPDVIVEFDSSGEPRISFNHETMPRLGISRKYRELLDAPGTDENTRIYIKEKLARAKELKTSIANREKTIVRVARCILRHQRDLFTIGDRSLIPLTRKQIADELNLEDTTISRAVNGKYMQTPWGNLVEFSRFFSAGSVASNEGEASAEAVKHEIQKIINGEDRRKPLSDERIAGELQSRGYKLVSRTVGKYREQMGIKSSRGRRMP